MIDTSAAVAILGAACLLGSLINMLIAGKINALAQQTLSESRNAANAASAALILARDLMNKERSQ